MIRRHVVIERYGPSSTLELREEPVRSPNDDEVAIDVAYSGINFADIMMRLGLYPDAPKKPFVPGYEVAGVVAEIGRNVKNFRVGDAVAAGTYFGGYASRVVIPATQLMRIPSYLGLDEAAALPVNFFTAHVALFEMARIRAGDRVLIECATGGVGVLAIQMARHAGAEVVGLTTSPAKKDFIKACGATPYTRDEFHANPSLRGYDMVLNASGGSEVEWQRSRLGITGRMVCIGISSGIKDGRRNLPRVILAALQTPRISVLRLFNQNTGIYALNALHVLRDPTWIMRLTNAFDQFAKLELKPHIGKVFPAVDVAQAHRFLETKQATGKVLITWR